MKLVTRKSECIKVNNTGLVKSPKEAIRKTLSNYLISDGVIIQIYQPSYVSKEEAVLCDTKFANEMKIQLETKSTLLNKIAN